MARPWRAKAATAVGALISLVILLAVVVWSYRLGVRDAEDIPVIRAELEATKIRPEEPGGLEVAHQDRAVYSVVSGEAAEDAPTLAPPPVNLAEEDLAPVAAAPETTIAPEPTGRPEAPSVAAPPPIPSPEPRTDEPVETAAEADAAPEAQPAPVVEQAEETIETAAVDPSVAGEPPAEPVENTPAPLASPTPVRRPTRTIASISGGAEDAEPREAASASRIQIQLGAFDSEAIAAEQWTAIKNRNGDILAGRGRVIMPVTSGGRQLYRLRAGPFETVDQASALCRGLKARNEACIVARAR